MILQMQKPNPLHKTCKSNKGPEGFAHQHNHRDVYPSNNQSFHLNHITKSEEDITIKFLLSSSDMIKYKTKRNTA